ncbi:MAG: hypothetical protein ACKVJP_01355 [Flavobacteriales bacterium]|jgi:hypothetical protein|tara:strand:- start:1233 stop:1568 length:336 start_codon:yes stop_codon:yes gene_type:complete
MENLEINWNEALKKLEPVFGGDIDLQGALFIIGIQELGKGPRKFNKRQKLEVIHIAVCRLLSDYGFYEFKGYDEDSWPHYERTTRLPKLEGKNQEKLMKEAIINYLNKQVI